MRVKPPKVTLSEVSQIIDLKDAVGVDLSDYPDVIEAIGQKIIDRIRERTEAGTAIRFDENGNARFSKLKAPYSKTYSESMEFKAFGKKPAQVNMKLTGDMLGLLDFERDRNKLKIGWDDDEQIKKAFNHITGDTVPQRPFFGISKGELRLIVQEFKPVAEAVKSNDKTAVNETLSMVLDSFGDEDGED